jgi:hypothetical protein
MGWRAIIGNLLMKVGDSLPVPATPVFADPFNYTLASLLQDSRRPPAALRPAVQEKFPEVTPAHYATICQQIEAAYTLAADLASAVNQRHLSQDEASERLKQAFPQMEPANVGGLLLQNLVGTR